MVPVNTSKADSAIADLALLCFYYNGKKVKQMKEKVYLACPNCGASLSLRMVVNACIATVNLFPLTLSF